MGWRVGIVSGPDHLMTRRRMLLLLLAGLLALPAQHAFADDGKGDGGGDDGGGDDGGDDDGGGDDDDDDDGGGTVKDGSGGGKNSISDAVKNGKAVPLKDILAVVREKYDGEVVRITLTGPISRLVYNIRIVDTQDRLIEVRVNALSRRIISTKGL